MQRGKSDHDPPPSCEIFPSLSQFWLILLSNTVFRDFALVALPQMVRLDPPLMVAIEISSGSGTPNHFQKLPALLADAACDRQVYKTSATKHRLIAKLTSKKPRARHCAVAEVLGSDSTSLRALLSPADEMHHGTGWLGDGRRLSRDGVTEHNGDVIEVSQNQ